MVIDVILKNGIVVPCAVCKSSRVRRPSLTMYPDGRLIAKIPFHRTIRTAQRLLKDKYSWVEKHYLQAQRVQKTALPVLVGKELRDAKKRARVAILERLEYFNQLYGFSYKKVFIKDTRAQWGSCSSKQNLNFTYRLILLPPHLLDYVVVHELCHVKHMNHSKQFWNEVARALPEYKKYEKELGTYMLR